MRRPGLSLSALGLAAILVSACSGSAVLNGLQSGAGIRVAEGLAYGEGPRRRLDVYAPEEADGTLPVAVFFYGGSWDSGDRAMYGFVGKALAAEGFVTVIPDYRVYPEVAYPEFLRDNAAAVRWARDHAGEHGGDPDNLVLIGHSAGAYNAAMLTLDRRWLDEVGLDPKRDLRAMAGLAGPYDFLPLGSAPLKKIFAPADDLEDTQPVNQVKGPPPPMFLAAARGDTTVRPRNTTRLAERVREAGGEVEERYYDGLGHAMVVGTLSDPLEMLAPIRDDLVAFLRAHTGR